VKALTACAWRPVMISVLPYRVATTTADACCSGGRWAQRARAGATPAAVNVFAGIETARAGVAADVIRQYANVEQAALDGFYRIAEAKLLAAQKTPHGRDHDYH
jgi:hypothetical protein